jgi:hypothetical protein
MLMVGWDLFYFMLFTVYPKWFSSYKAIVCLCRF